MPEKELEAIPMTTFRILIYKASIEDYIKKNWDGFKLNINFDDIFFINIDQDAMCKALVNSAWNKREIGGISSYNKIWAIKLIEYGIPKDLEYCAQVPATALDQLITVLRNIYHW